MGPQSMDLGSDSLFAHLYEGSKKWYLLWRVAGEFDEIMHVKHIVVALTDCTLNSH